MKVTTEQPIRRARPECRNVIIRSMESHKHLFEDKNKGLDDLKESQRNDLYQTLRVLM